MISGPQSVRETPVTTNFEPKSHLEILTELIFRRLEGRVRNFSLELDPEGLTIGGLAQTQHARNLARHVVMEMSNLPIVANNIEVEK